MYKNMQYLQAGIRKYRFFLADILVLAVPKMASYEEPKLRSDFCMKVDGSFGLVISGSSSCSLLSLPALCRHICLFFLSRGHDTDNSPSWIPCHSFCSAAEEYIYNAVRQYSACWACWLDADLKDCLTMSCFKDFIFSFMALSRTCDETQKGTQYLLWLITLCLSLC